MTTKIKSIVIELINRFKYLININNNRILFTKNKYEYNFNKLERFWINTHMLGANSVLDWGNGIISYEKRIKALIDIGFLLILYLYVNLYFTYLLNMNRFVLFLEKYLLKIKE
jgi:hypothetical protein